MPLVTSKFSTTCKLAILPQTLSEKKKKCIQRSSGEQRTDFFNWPQFTEFTESWSENDLIRVLLIPDIVKNPQWEQK